jgi:hypothetical protein
VHERLNRGVPGAPDWRLAMCSLELTADCRRCCALCCVVYPFVRSPEFAADKPAYVACGHVTAAFTCAIHSERAGLGYPGCMPYDCHGAGQYVTHVLFGGQAWTDVEEPAVMFEVFLVLRALFAQLSLLQTALTLDLADAMRSALSRRDAQLRALLERPLAELRAIDAQAERATTDRLLRELAAHVDRDGRTVTSSHAI